MEELLSLAARVGLNSQEGEAVTGALLWVVKTSKATSKDDFKKVLETIEGSDALKAYERKAFVKKLPNPAMMLIPKPGFAPPGPPPPVIIKAAYTGIKRAVTSDKDAMHTQEAVRAMEKSGIDKEKVLEFIPVFIVYLQEKTNTDVSDILRLPEEKKEEDDEKK